MVEALLKGSLEKKKARYKCSAKEPHIHNIKRKALVQGSFPAPCSGISNPREGPRWKEPPRIESWYIPDMVKL